MASHDTIGSVIWISYPGQFFFFLKKASWQSGVLLRKRVSESTTLGPNRNTRVVKCFPPLSDHWVLCLRTGDGPWEVKTSEHHLASAGPLLQSLIRLLLLNPWRALWKLRDKTWGYLNLEKVVTDDIFKGKNGVFSLFFIHWGAMIKEPDLSKSNQVAQW